MEMLRRAWDILRPRPEGIEIPPNLFSVGSLVSPSLVGKPQWTNAGTRTFDEEGYRKLSLIFRCVGLTANSLGSASMRVYDDNKNGMEVESHPFRQLMKRPNPMMGESRFLSMIGMRATVSGFCVVEKERSAAGRVVALWPMRSDWVKPIPRSQAAPDWEVRIPRIPRPIKLPAEDVIVFTYADRPDGSPTGIGPLETALREVDLLNAMTDFVKAFFDRGATPVFGLIPDLEPGYRPTQKEIDELKARWITRNLGIRNAVEPAVMVGIKDVKRLSFDFSELAYTDLRDISDIAITTAFGVKPGLVGARIGIERNTMSNAEEDRRAFYEDVISPLWGRLDDAFTLDLLPEFPNYEGLDIRFDTSKIAALQEDRNAKATWVVQATLGGAMTVHAMHRELGLPVPDGDDFFLRGLTQQVIPASDPLSGSLARESELELLGGRGATGAIGR